jgi:hypothetical protein
MQDVGLRNINKYQQVASAQVVQAVQTASAKTGVDFNFLMEKAAAESGFKSDAKAKTSSARGLFQFIENTWLGMVKQHGDKYGLSAYADQIETDAKGRLCVKDCDIKDTILNLRNDPKISALMAGEFAAENKSALERATKLNVGDTELYLAHFMGAGTAARFLNSRQVNPDAAAAEIFPTAARSNKNVFFNKDGSSKSLDEIYQSFAKKFGEAGTPVARAEIPAAPQYVAEIPAARLPFFDDQNKSDDIIWNDDPRFYKSTPRIEKLSPMSLMVLVDMQQDVFSDKPRYNS